MGYERAIWADFCTPCRISRVLICSLFSRSNPRVPCKSGILPSIDFSKWADYSGQASAPNSVPFVSNVHL